MGTLAGFHLVVAGSAQAVHRLPHPVFEEAGATVTTLADGEGTDLASPDGAERAWAELEAVAPRPVDGLVVVGSEPEARSFLDAPVAAQDRVMRELAVAMNTARAFGTRALPRRAGRLVFVRSVLAQRGLPNASLPAAVDGGVVAFARALSLEWVRAGISVNAVCTHFLAEEGGMHGDPGVRRALERFTPIGRLGSGADVARVVRYLLGPQAAFVVGQAVVVDGGLTTHA